MERDVDRLLGAPERRSCSIDQFELRGDGDSLKLTGYASVFEEPYPIFGGASGGGWDEIVDRGAFDRTLSEKPDTHLLINHEGMPLARTKSGTMRLSTDDRGLHVEADLDRRDPDVQALQVKMERGDMDEMSFAFRTIRHQWNDDETERRMLEVSIHKGDVSVVNFGANPATAAQLRSLMAALAEDDDKARQIVRDAVRHLDPQVAVKVRASISLEIRRGAAPDARRLTVAEAQQIVSL